MDRLSIFLRSSTIGRQGPESHGRDPDAKEPAEVQSTVCDTPQNRPHLLSFPDELLLSILSHSFALTLEEVYTLRNRRPKDDGPDYRSIRLTCRRLNTLVSTDFAMTYHLGLTARMRIKRATSSRKYHHIATSTHTHNIRKFIASAALSISRHRYKEADNVKEAKFVRGLDVLSKLHLFDGLEEVEMVLSDSFDTCPYVNNRIVSAMTVSCVKLENLRSLYLYAFIPSPHGSLYATDAWHGLMGRLQSFSLRFNKRHKLPTSTLSLFAEEFGREWLPYLISVQILELWFSWKDTDELFGKAFGEAQCPELVNFQLGTTTVWKGILDFLEKHKEVVKWVCIRGATHGLMADWCRTAWPLVEKKTGWEVWRRVE